MQKEFIIRRLPQNNECTPGIVYQKIDTEWKQRWVSLERRWENNQKNISCIPTGDYLIKRTDSPSFGEVFTIVNVPGRDLIRIHILNVVSESKGCPGFGMTFGVLFGKFAILSSKIAFDQFMAELKGIDTARLLIRNFCDGEA